MRDETGEEQHDRELREDDVLLTHLQGGLHFHRRQEQADRPEQSISGHSSRHLSPTNSSDARDQSVGPALAGE